MNELTTASAQARRANYEQVLSIVNDVVQGGTRDCPTSAARPAALALFKRLYLLDG